MELDDYQFRPITFQGVTFPATLMGISVLEPILGIKGEDLGDWLWRLPICKGFTKHASAKRCSRCASQAADLMLDCREQVLKGIRDRLAPQGFEPETTYRDWLMALQRIAELSASTEGECVWSAPSHARDTLKTEKPFGLPHSAVEFLKAGEQFDYDYSNCHPRRVGLKHLDQLALAEVHVCTEDTEGMEDDPHAAEFGYYIVPAVSLSGECTSYNPEFILLWLPDEQMFGAYDDDHSVLTVFPDTTWDDIVADPIPYLDAQWYPERGVGVPFQPWPKYEFRLFEN
jgi:hypothetical protein